MEKKEKKYVVGYHPLMCGSIKMLFLLEICVVAEEIDDTLFFSRFCLYFYIEQFNCLLLVSFNPVHIILHSTFHITPSIRKKIRFPIDLRLRISHFLCRSRADFKFIKWNTKPKLTAWQSKWHTFSLSRCCATILLVQLWVGTSIDQCVYMCVSGCVCVCICVIWNLLKKVNRSLTRSILPFSSLFV